MDMYGELKEYISLYGMLIMNFVMQDPPGRHKSIPLSATCPMLRKDSEIRKIYFNNFIYSKSFAN